MRKQTIWLVVVLIVILVPLIFLLYNLQSPGKNVDLPATTVASAGMAPTAFVATETLAPATTLPATIPSTNNQVAARETLSPGQADSRAYVAVESAEGSLLRCLQ